MSLCIGAAVRVWIFDFREQGVRDCKFRVCALVVLGVTGRWLRAGAAAPVQAAAGQGGGNAR